MTIAFGCGVGLALHSWCATVDYDLRGVVASAIGRTASHVEMSAAVIARRCTMWFTPMVWAAAIYALCRAVRTRAVLDELWLLGVTAVALLVYPRADLAQLLGLQAALPLYAIGSALAVAWLLEHATVGRRLAVVWLAVVPVLAAHTIAVHSRRLLDREDVAQANAYLAAHDRNDFMISNLGIDGPIEYAFGRHPWLPPAQSDTHLAANEVLGVLASTGTDYVHAVIFNSRATPAERNELANLVAMGAVRVVHTSTLDLYRLDRAALLDKTAAAIPVASAITATNSASAVHRSLGWGPPWTNRDRIDVFSLDGFTAMRGIRRLPARSAGMRAETISTRAYSVLSRSMATTCGAPSSC